MSLSVEHFSTLLRDPGLESKFDIDFAVRIGERGRELQRLEFRFLFLLLPFVFLLGAFDSEFVQNITIFGISFSKDNATLGVLLLISAILMLFSSAVSIVATYYNKILEGYISVYHDERVINYYMHQFQWNIGSIFDTLRSNTSNISHNPFTISVVGFWAVSLICATIILKVLILLIFAGATISTLNIPSIPTFINIPIVVLAACAIVFDLTCLLLQCPLPFTDYSNMERLKELEKTNPDMADEIRKNIATRGLDRDRRNSIILQAIVLVVFVIGPTWFAIGNNLFTKYEIVLQVFLGLAAMLMVISPLVDRIERKILEKVFKMEDKELSLKRYISTKKWVWGARLILAAAIGFGVFLRHQ